MDDFAAFDRYLNIALPIETNIGTVVGVEAVSVTVSLKGGKPQPATYSPEQVLSRGDTVMLIRPRGSMALWSVAAVIGRQATGFSNANLPATGHNPGAKAWANPTVTIPPTFYDVTSTGRALVLEINKEFNGGLPMVVLSGFAAPTTTAATLILGVAIDDLYYECYRHYMATTNSYATCFTFLGRGALNGSHRIQLYGAVSPANTVRMNPKQFSVVEI